MNDTATPIRDKKANGDTAGGNAKDKAENAQPRKSRFETFASTQSAGDGIEGDVLKPGKTVDEKLGAIMPDRK